MHAPLPYSVEGEGQDTVGILSIDNHYAAFLKGRAKESQGDTAAFIVRACNSHYELLEALECVSTYYSGSLDHQPPYVAIARAALAKAKGEA